MLHPFRLIAGFLLVGVSLTRTAAAQDPPLVLPDQSPRAAVSQTVGLTDFTIDYGRPGVNGRRSGVVWFRTTQCGGPAPT